MGEFVKKLGREVFERVILSHRSTLTGIGLGAVILVADQVAQALGASHQSWAPVAAGLVTLVSASLKSKKVAADAAAAKELVPPAVLALIIGGALLFAAPARADDVEPVLLPIPTAGVCFDVAHKTCLRPLVSFAGTAYDFSHHSVIRSFQASALYELTLPGPLFGKVGLAGGAGFQGGDIVGAALTGGVTLPFNLAVLASGVVVGTKASVTAAVGYVARFP